MAEYTQTIKITKDLADLLQKVLDWKDGIYPEWGKDEVHTLTAKFPTGIEADIKVVNGDSPYVDPVLFEKNGSELTVIEPTDTILGEYIFWDEKDNYIVKVEIG